MTLRPYQSLTVEQLFTWWEQNDGIPLAVLPTAAGKSVICAEVVRTMFEQWPDFHPRTVVLVPSKELAEQNAEKLVALLPRSISVGFVSASLGKKQHQADVIVATIGSIAKSAHLLGNIKVVIIDEAHLVSNKGEDAGMYRRFLTDLSKICQIRVMGMTATPFRGNGVWLTDGDAPLFTGVAANVTMRALLDAGFIAPLVPPTDRIGTKIDATSVGLSNGDYKINELSAVVDKYLAAVATESWILAADRKKWIAFTPSVANAEHLCKLFGELNIKSAVVCGDTPANERATSIRDFKAGRLHCLVTVLALSVGFDVPDVDCIIWCRPTKSPVLYVQGMGRGVRIAPGKTDCLVLDFTDTVERLGPVDLVRGRSKKAGGFGAPYVLCPECGEQNHATALVCKTCGATIREESPALDTAVVSRAALLSSQVIANREESIWHDITSVMYVLHQKPDKPNSLRVDYYSGILRIASEWVCLEHIGYARQKAEQWWNQRLGGKTPETVAEALVKVVGLKEPARICIARNGKFTEVKSHDFTGTKAEEAGVAEHAY